MNCQDQWDGIRQIHNLLKGQNVANYNFDSISSDFDGSSVSIFRLRNWRHFNGRNSTCFGAELSISITRKFKKQLRINSLR